MGFRKVLAAALGAAMALQLVAMPSGAWAGEAGAAPLPRVQLPAFMAPIVKADGQRGMVPLTLVMHVANAKEVTKLCKLLPLVQDGVMQVLYARQIRQAADGKLDVTGLRERLIAAANKSLGTKLVQDAEIYEGMRPGGPGGAKFAGWQMCREISKSHSE